MFAKRISFLLGAQISLSNAFAIIAQHENMQNKYIFAICQEMSAGKKLSEITAHTFLFGTTATALIVLGEETGTLDRSFEKIVDQLEQSYELKQKIIGALLYPSVVALGTVGLLLGLIIGVFPRLQNVFAGLRVELPLMTRVVITLSIWLRSYWWIVFIGVIVLGGISVFVLKQYKIQKYIQKTLLYIPIIRTLITSYYQIKIFSVVGLLLEQGSDLAQALRVVTAHTNHWWYKKILEESLHRLQSGKTVSDLWQKKSWLFEVDAVSVITIGERSGSLAESFLYAAKYAQEKLDQITKIVTQSIEPLLMIAIGLIVALIAISIITPMYQITEHLKIR